MPAKSQMALGFRLMSLKNFNYSRAFNAIRNTFIVVGLFLSVFTVLQIKFERPRHQLDDILGNQVVARIAVGQSIKEALSTNKITTWSDNKLQLDVRIKPNRIVEHDGETCGLYHIRIRLKNKLQSWQDKTCKRAGQPW